TSIDELPQLINILKGEMSLVGPRPSLPKEVAKFEPWMLERLEVKPGLTCYWQVMGRNDIDFEDWMKLDIKYVHDRNLWLDIKLIFKTFFVLFGDESAS
ncbi:sugar transferase, partial [Clostridium perfringens]